MTSKDIQQKSVGKGLAWMISLGIHGVFLAVLIIFGFLSPEKEKISSIRVTMTEMPAPAPVLPQEPETIPEPEPEPPAPEPPAPEPEPPKLEPAPVPEPPKPVKKEVKKTAVVPVKKVQKVTPVKKKTAPEPKKPAPKPKKQSFEERFRERMAKSKVVTAKDRPPRKTSSRNHSMSKNEISRRLNQGVRNTVSTVSVTGTAGSSGAGQSEVNYAQMVVHPYLRPLWNQMGPGRGELGGSEVKPVEITMLIYADGRVGMPEILKKSDSPAMNRAAERILMQLRRKRFSPLKAKGITESQIRVNILLTAVF